MKSPWSATRRLIAAGIVLVGMAVATPAPIHADATTAMVAVREGQLSARVADAAILTSDDGASELYRLTVEVRDNRGTGQGWIATAQLPPDWSGQLDEVTAACGRDSTCTLPAFSEPLATAGDSGATVLAGADAGTGMGDIVITATFTLDASAAGPPPADVAVASPTD